MPSKLQQFSLHLSAVALLILVPATQAIAQEGDPDRPVITGDVPTPTGSADMFIKFDGIDGEAKDSNHDKWIDVLSVDWGAAGDPAAQSAERPRRAANPRARRRGDVIMTDVTISKGYDAASVKLMEACARGAVVPKVDVYLMRSSDGAYLKYELKNVMVTSYSLSGSGEGGVPTESVTLNFAEVEWTYAETDDTEKDKKQNIEMTVVPDRVEG
jgi:type VI secretion system secreted protein Hcp